MTRRAAWILVAGGLAIVAALAAFASMLRYGFGTHDEPTAIERLVARTVRHWAVPADLRDMKNPVLLTPEVLAEARAHFADHCATCHGNDGRGTSGLGMQMYPKTPDITQQPTQSLSDGELFAIIENGIRLTGMPGFGSGTAESAYGSWTLVHFIRHLPDLTTEEIAEMEALNPKTPAEFEAMQEEREFLGADTPAPPHHQ